MASKIDIINGALSKIAKKPISGLEESTYVAKVCKGRYDYVLDVVLQDHPWSFATSRRFLNIKPPSPESGYTYSYDLPSDCLQIIKEVHGHKYSREEDNRLNCNYTPVKIVYTKKISDPNLMSPYFIEVFTLYLAADICYNLTHDSRLAKHLSSSAEFFLRKARLRNAQEDTPDKFPEGSWISCRR